MLLTCRVQVTWNVGAVRAPELLSVNTGTLSSPVLKSTSRVSSFISEVKSVHWSSYQQQRSCEKNPETSSREAATSGALIAGEPPLVVTSLHYTAVIIMLLVWPSGHREDKVGRGSLKTNTAQHGITAPSRLLRGWDRRGLLVRRR